MVIVDHTVDLAVSQPAKAEPRRVLRGFTLIELVVVLTIIAALGAVALSRFGQITARARVRSAAAKLVADLEFARTQARISSRPQTVAFSTSTSSYELIGLASMNDRTRAFRVSLATEPYSVRLASAAFAGAPTLTFSIYGVPVNAGSVVLTSGAYSRTVKVDASTGGVSTQ